MNEQQQLMALMVLAEKQQAAVQAAIEGLKEQQKALEKATEGVQRAASSGAAAAVGQTMSNASKFATEAFNAATTTTLGKLRAAATDADEAQDRLSRATLTFGFKWVGVAVVTLAACLILFSAVAFFLVGWKEYQVKNLTDQRAELIEEVDKLKKSAAEFSKLAGKAKLSQCGEQNRLCVEVDKAAGLFGKKNIDFAVIKGY